MRRRSTLTSRSRQAMPEPGYFVGIMRAATEYDGDRNDVGGEVR